MSVKDRIKTATKRALASADLSMMTTAKLESIQQRALIGDKAQLLALFADADIRKSLDLLVDSRSQLNQDLFVLSSLGWKRDGYYVEFGATDGETLSNTWLLDKRFGWRGILAEPARIWRNALECAGRNAKLEFECVWSESGQTLEFEEAALSELSTIKQFSETDYHHRRGMQTYKVNTVSLNDMLDRHDAPALMDFLSIDTEGSELTILQSLDFSRYKFRCITCEHNHNSHARDSIKDLLTANGYLRVYEDQTNVDDWYVLHE